MEEIIEIVSDKISKKLQDQIKSDVFTTPNDWYERTGQFEKSWSWGDVKKTITSLTKEFAYDPSVMSWNPNKWQHGNPKQSAVDNLADILNLAFNNYSDGYTSDLKFGGRHFSHLRKPYWENFIKELFDKEGLEKMFTEEFSKRGIIKV